MKKIFVSLFIGLLVFQLNAFDLNGMWSCHGVLTKGPSKEKHEYSWGTVQEPSGIGFSIDLLNNDIYTNRVWCFLIDLEYDEENQTISFIHPLVNEKETYYITVISDYEIELETDYHKGRDPLINASLKGSDKKVHYFKIAGPENAKVLKAPVYAILLDDVELKFKDYKGIIYDFGPVKKGTRVELIDYREGLIPEITDMDFVYHVLVNPELGGYVDPRAIEFIDDITINGYGGKITND